MQLTLANNCELYGGQYVAVKSFANRDIVSHGTKPAEVMSAAIALGIAEPVLIFIPEKGMVHVY